MKKLFITLILLLTAISCIHTFNFQVLAKETVKRNWEKINDYIYLDKNSISIKKYSTSGWFKRYNCEKEPISDINGVPVYYELNKYDVDCDSNVVCIVHFKSFDKNNKLIDEEVNYNCVCAKYSGWIDGEIYFNALCKYNK